MAKISFLVTFYNQEKYVKKCLDSILNVVKPIDWEILIGDDGSSDRTIDIIKKYILRYPNNIFLYVMPRDLNIKYNSVKRASENRLFLLEKSNADYFCIIDGDDYYCDYTFLHDAINEHNAHEDASIIAFGYQTIRNKIVEKKYTLTKKNTAQLLNTQKYISSMYTPAGACVFKNIPKSRIQYIKYIGYFDDNDIFINNINYGNIYAINKIIYAYTQKDNSIYNNMNFLEQCILNIQGYDVDCLLIDKKYKKYLLDRIALPIIYTYIYNDKIEKELGNIKYLYYLNSAEHYQSLLSAILLKDTKSKRTINKLAIKHPFFYLKTLIKKIILS